MKKFVSLALIMLVSGIIVGLISFDWKDIRSFGTETVFIEKTIASGTINKINTEAGYMNTEIIRGNTEDIKVRIDGKASKKYKDRFNLEAEANGDLLNIKSSYKDMFSIGLNIVDVDLIIELPERLWDEISINSSTGNIEVEQLNTSVIAIKTFTGNIDVEQLRANSGELQSGTGNIEADEINVNTISLKASSGNVKVENYTAEKITVRAASGNLVLEDGTGSVDGQTNSGNIRLVSEVLKHNVFLKSGSGNVRIDVEQEPQSVNFYFRTGSGNFNSNWSNLNVKSDNDDEYIGKIGSGEMTIEVKTNSGNLKLDKD